MLVMWDAFVCEKLCTSQEGFSFFFFFSIILNKPLLIRMYANIFIVVIVVLFASQTSSSSISFPFFCAPSQNKKIYSPFFWFHSFFIIIGFAWSLGTMTAMMKVEVGRGWKWKSKTQICGQRFETNKLKRWKLVWMQWAESLIRDMTIIFATICIRKTRMTGEILIKNLFVQTLWKYRENAKMRICMKSCFKL